MCGILPSKITDNSDYYSEILPYFKLLVMLQCSVWYALII